MSGAPLSVSPDTLAQIRFQALALAISANVDHAIAFADAATLYALGNPSVLTAMAKKAEAVIDQPAS